MTQQQHEALDRMTKAALLREVAALTFKTLHEAAGLNNNHKAIPVKDCLDAGVSTTDFAAALDKAKDDPRIKRMAAAAVGAISQIVDKG